MTATAPPSLFLWTPEAPPVTLQPTPLSVGSSHPLHWPLPLSPVPHPTTCPQDPRLHSPINSVLQPRPQFPSHAPNLRSDALAYDSYGLFVHWVPRQAGRPVTGLTLTRTRTTSRSSSSTAAAAWAPPAGGGAAESEAAGVVAIPPLSSLSR